jgi:hypothetical protein
MLLSGLNHHSPVSSDGQVGLLLGRARPILGNRSELIFPAVVCLSVMALARLWHHDLLARTPAVVI